MAEGLRGVGRAWAAVESAADFAERLVEGRSTEMDNIGMYRAPRAWVRDENGTMVFLKSSVCAAAVFMRYSQQDIHLKASSCEARLF